MNLDDEERAGTRSRKYIKKKGLSFFTLVFTILLLLFLYNLQPSQKQINVTKDIFEIKKHFKDTEEWTDYSFLRAQLTEPPKKSVTPNQETSMMMNNNNNNNMFHTFDQLRQLTNPIILSNIFAFKSTRRVPVTAVIHTINVNQVYHQLKSVLTQTAVAESIWVVCKDTDEKALVMDRIETLDKRRVHVMVANEEWWFRMISNTASEYIWIIDQNSVPGKRYLEHVLKLVYTDEYKNTLIGTQAYSRGSGCIPLTADINSKPMKSQEVEMLVDNWLIYRTWIPILLESKTTEQQQQSEVAEKVDEEEDKWWFLGLTISKKLWKAGIRTVALPTDPIERAYSGDIRERKKITSRTCQAIEEWAQQQKEQEQQQQQQENGDDGNVLMYKRSSEIIFFADSEEQVIQLAPLYCSFSSITSNKQQLMVDFVSSLPKDMVEKHIKAYCDDGDHYRVHTLDLQNKALRQSALMHALENHIIVTKPSVMIHTTSTSSTSSSSSSPINALLLNQLKVTGIALPPQDIPHTLWMAELPLYALQKWNDIKVKIMINSNNKPHGLSRLLQSLNQAHLLNDDIDLTILLDYTTDRVTQNVAQSFQWPSKKYLRHRIVPAQRAPLFTEAWYPTTNDEYAIILDTMIELSPYFYTWTKYNLLYHRYVRPHKQIFGISLYSPRLLETDDSGRKLFEPPESHNTTSNSYFMQWPSHLGAVFFPEHWREFHDYMTARLADQSVHGMQEIELEGVRSSQWSVSWRRYFEELIYLRGYVMVFPNFNFFGLSTSHIELRTQAMREEFAQAISLFETPLMETDSINELELKTTEAMDVLDLWGEKRHSLEELKLIGREYQEKVSACTTAGKSNEFDDFDPTDLLCPFARIVSVTLENEKDPIPELPIRQVTIYKNSYL